MHIVKDYSNSLSISYVGILLTSVVLFVASIGSTKINDYTSQDLPYIIVGTILIIGAYIFAYLCSDKKTKEAKQKRGLREKLLDYRKGIIVVWLFLFFTIIVSSSFLLITGELYFICTTVFSLVLFLMNTPRISNVIKRLDLANDEQRILENPRSAI